MKQVSELAKEIGIRVYDETAVTTKELAFETGKCLDWVCRVATAKCKAGKWELVWKKINGRATPAYRKKK